METSEKNEILDIYNCLIDDNHEVLDIYNGLINIRIHIARYAIFRKSVD